MSHTIASLAQAAGTTDEGIDALIRNGFISPCGFKITGLDRWAADVIEALAFETQGFDFEPLIPDSTARAFLALLPPDPDLRLPRTDPMLVLKRKEGQWVEITHKSGDLLRIRVCQIEPGHPGHLNLAFDDTPRNFEIQRPERHRKAGDGEAA